MDSNNFIKHITLENYKSIKKLDLELKPLNVLIGSNGAGKSNLISFFNLLRKMEAGELKKYVLSKGGQDVFLCYGQKESEFLSASLDVMRCEYFFSLMPTVNDFFQFTAEDFMRYSWWNTGNSGNESQL